MAHLCHLVADTDIIFPDTAVYNMAGYWGAHCRLLTTINAIEYFSWFLLLPADSSDRPFAEYHTHR